MAAQVGLAYKAEVSGKTTIWMEGSLGNGEEHAVWMPGNHSGKDGEEVPYACFQPISRSMLLECRYRVFEDCRAFPCDAGFSQVFCRLSAARPESKTGGLQRQYQHGDQPIWNQ